MENINIPVHGSSVFGDEFEVSLSIDVSHLVYGYGYGDFDASEESPSYFDVFSVAGDGIGYGFEEKNGYQYGWGYERTDSVAGDGSDSMLIVATVTDNGEIPAEPSGIPIVFTASPGVILSHNYDVTDSNGQAWVYARIDSSALRNLDVFGSNGVEGERERYGTYPSLGYMRVEASIPRSMVKKDWKVFIGTISTQNLGQEAFEFIRIPTVSVYNSGS